MKFIHIHGYKCAGTTFEKILQREFPDLLRIESKNSGQRLFYEQIPDKLKTQSALTSHLLAPSDKVDCFQVSFIRDPYKRLVSAWRFQNKIAGNIECSLKEFINKYRASIISNYQTKLLSVQHKNNTFSSGWDVDINLEFIFGDNFFLGVVERFDESMVILEMKLKQLNINIDLSYPSRENTADNSLQDKSDPQNLSKFAYSSIDTDLWLLKEAHLKLDKEIANIDSFKERFVEYKDRCKKSTYLDYESKIIYI